MKLSVHYILGDLRRALRLLCNRRLQVGGDYGHGLGRSGIGDGGNCLPDLFGDEICCPGGVNPFSQEELS